MRGAEHEENPMDAPPADVNAIWREHRSYLVDLAFRMLGNIHDAEDAVQEGFSRLLHQNIDDIDDVRGWLVVVVSRACIDHLRSARVRREAQSDTLGDQAKTVTAAPPTDPADRVTLDDSIGIAMLVLLRRLSPAERAAFVLHDVFQFSFDAIAPIVGRSPVACRQLASRARRRIEDGTDPERFTVEAGEQHRVTAGFIAACASGDIEALMAMLAPDVSGDVDFGGIAPARAPQHGRTDVTRNLFLFFGPDSGTTLVSQPVNGGSAFLAFREGRLFAIVQLDVRDDIVHELHAIVDPAKLALMVPFVSEVSG
jgi:RNA polymerase sigma-70 factor, ECF subfamily